MLKILKGSASRSSIILLAGASLLSACGGGGGSDDPVLGIVPGNPNADTSDPLGSYYVLDWSAQEQEAENRRNHSKYTVQTGDWSFGGALGGVTRTANAILSSGVEYAHAAGLTGAGQIVAIIDAGFSKTHQTLAGVDFNGGPTTDVDDHGTVVAAIIAGKSSTFIGIAPGASLYVEDYQNYTAMKNATDWARTHDAVAQNNSWGPQYGDQTEVEASVSGLNYFKSGGATAYLTALGNYAAQGVVVFALSNDEDRTQADLMAGLPYLIPSLESGWIAVGNGFPVFDSNGNLTHVYMVSSACLEAAAWCIVGNGSWEHIPDSVDGSTGSNTAYTYGTGTSYVAPQVAGALALLAEAFPELSEHDLRLRLLASADNSFFATDGVADTLTMLDMAPGSAVYNHQYSSIYGHGFLDIAAALLPIGTPLATLADGTEIDTRTAWMGTGSAMGDAVQKSLASVKVKVSDVLGANFGLSGDKLFAQAQTRTLAVKALPRAIGTDLTALRINPLQPIADAFGEQDGRTFDFASPDGVFSATLLMPDEGSGSENLGLSVMRSVETGGLRFDYGLKVARDDGALIGFGDTGNGGATTGMAALQLALSQEFANGGFFSLSGEVGRADLNTPAGFNSVSSTTFNAVGLELGQRNLFAGGDRLALGVSLPMAVTSGTASLSLPSFGDGLTRSVTFEDVAIDLSPDARQIDFALTYQMPVGEGKELMLKAMHSENYGNIEGVRDQALVAAFKWSF